MANAGETTSVTRKGSGFKARAAGDPIRENQRMFPSFCRHGRNTAANAGRNYSHHWMAWQVRLLSLATLSGTGGAICVSSNLVAAAEIHDRLANTGGTTG